MKCCCNRWLGLLERLDEAVKPVMQTTPLLKRAVLKSLVIFRGELCSGDVFKLEVKIGFLQKLYLYRFRNFWLNIEIGANF
ncbi:hypothetical protein P8452_03609 [Trifolium repens]|nr:hypothetical protein P8452_03609 [Trifolium repens]